MTPFHVIWQRVIAHAGQSFRQKMGQDFTYSVAGKTLTPTGINRNIPITDFQSAYRLVPFTGPGIINHSHQGPSFIWGVLHDPRIVGPLCLIPAHSTHQYYPLELFFKCIPFSSDSITVSFQQIELILRVGLPASAFTHRAWWTNNISHVQAKAWMNAGFEVTRNGVNLLQGHVQFMRH